MQFGTVCAEAGFDGEWTATNQQRSQQRQVQVEANIATTANPNRPTQYRTITATQTQQHAEQEAEER